MSFNSELDFQKALIKRLAPHKGWSPDILRFQTEEQLIQNWANILYHNNKEKDKLNNQPLTKGEIDQIINQLKLLKTPHKIHSFINGKNIQITRDNPADPSHLNKEISLKIYNRNEIAGGQSTYQISEQPRFSKHHPLGNERRGDFTLLINGMPVIHVELKKHKDYLAEGIRQIEKYTHEGVFTGFYSLVQLFVVITPEETIYFANPGRDNPFQKEFMFHWADFNNEPINDWETIAEQLLSIPMAHELIGFYSVADDTDNRLKVLRSYQYNAVKQISKKVSSTIWDDHDNKGGYIWHTTGSGKTLTSFKAAQHIAASNDADKVVFLMDRIELGTQSLTDYKKFANDDESVVGTESSHMLLSKLLSNNVDDTLIVTSIQKLSIIAKNSKIGPSDIEKINKKRIVIIVDECHRSTFGEMMNDIKGTFKRALFFGFSGTPIQEENFKKGCQTSDVFGDELHRYTIADGIRDKNVLGFDPHPVSTFKEYDLRKTVALDQCHAEDEREALTDKSKKQIYLYYINNCPMAGHFSGDTYTKGIEDFLPDSQYNKDSQDHKIEVVKDILNKWCTLSQNKFHAILATASIKEAIEYYRLFKQLMGKDGLPTINVSSIFDFAIDNDGGCIDKEDGLLEILEDYNAKYQKNYSIPTAGFFKKDACLRLAHKSPYEGLENTPNQFLDLIIVVEQLLTGFDSKWINALYIDKMLVNEHIIQAFSRTNRLYGPDKPHGIIKMYRRPFTMVERIKKALNTYSGNKPYGVFVDKLDDNIITLSIKFKEIKAIFESNGIRNFERLPDDLASVAKFSSLFKAFNYLLMAAKIQGLDWKRDEEKLGFGEQIYYSLLQRYKEIERGAKGPDKPPYDLDTYIIDIPTDKIDADYMNSKFTKFLKVLDGGNEIEKRDALDELHKTFATLTQEEQKQANIIIHDIYSGELVVEEGKSIKEYINEYLTKIRNTNDNKFASFLGVDVKDLKKFLEDIDKNDLDSFGRLSAFKKFINKQNLKEKLTVKYGHEYSIPKTNIKLDQLIRLFVECGGFDIDDIK